MSRNDCREFRIQLKTLRWLGVIRFSVDLEKGWVLESDSEGRKARIYLAVVLLNTCILNIYCSFYPHHLAMGKHNSTGNYYAQINIRSCSLVTLLVYIHLYVQRSRFGKLLESVLRLHRLLEGNSEAASSWILYILNMTLFVTCVLNYAHGYWEAGVRPPVIPIYLLQYGFAFLILGQIVGLFAFFQRILLAGFRLYNLRFKDSLKSAKPGGKFLKNFHDYTELVCLCREEMNRCFGLMILFIIGFIFLITPSGPFFLISTIFVGSFRRSWRFYLIFLTSIYWSIPWVALLYQVMGFTDVQGEVSILYNLEQYLTRNPPRLS